MGRWLTRVKPAQIIFMKSYETKPKEHTCGFKVLCLAASQRLDACPYGMIMLGNVVNLQMNSTIPPYRPDVKSNGKVSLEERYVKAFSL